MQGKRILLIDDDPDIQTFVKAVVRLEGGDLTVASSGEEGLQAFREKGPFDLLIVDINLPGIQGWDVLEAIKPSPTFLALPVLVFTGLADPVTQERATSLGAAGVIHKPIGARELVRYLKASLE